MFTSTLTYGYRHIVTYTGPPIYTHTHMGQTYTEHTNTGETPTHIGQHSPHTHTEDKHTQNVCDLLVKCCCQDVFSIGRKLDE